MKGLRELLKDKPKSPQDTVNKLAAALNVLENVAGGDSARTERKTELAQENVSKYLGFLKVHLFGDEEHEVTKEIVLDVAALVVQADLLALLVKHLPTLDFETRKDAAQVFGATVRIKDAQDVSIGALYVRQHSWILERLYQGYDEPAIALNCGSMLRDCLRDEHLARMLVEGPILLQMFEKVEVSNFEVASDAFSSFKDALTRHKHVVSQYLWEHYNEFFPAYSKLLQSGNYVVRRQSLKLLGELLLDRSNVKVMVRYVSEVQHLMQMMVLLKDTARNIQFEAFHVFKVFVANPNKPQPIIDILTNNRDKLLKYLEAFHTDKDDDEQFKEEKAVIIKEISMLGAPLQPTPQQQQQQQQPQQQGQEQPQAAATGEAPR